MKIERSKLFFRIIASLTILLLSSILVIWLYLMISQPSIIPLNETYGSFWLKNISLLIAAFAFASSALASAYNALEQRHLRYMENYPYLEIFSLLSVDFLPLPVPKHDLPPELASYNSDYLKVVAPKNSNAASDIEFRYLALGIRNVGHGYVTRIILKGSVEVPGRGFPITQFTVDRRFNLPPDSAKPFTLLPISGLPEYKVILSSVKYYGYFVELSDFDGKREIREAYPFSIPPERSENLFFDDFENFPVGLGWVLDFWGQWQPTPYSFIIQPSGDNHYLILSGNDKLFTEFYHYKNQGGAYIDLRDKFTYGTTARITARVRSLPNTTAKIQFWCNDLAPNPKDRFTNAITPDQLWQEISMLYTSTQSPNLRIHLLYTPGEGEIHIDRVTVEVLYT